MVGVLTRSSKDDMKDEEYLSNFSISPEYNSEVLVYWCIADAVS